MAFYKFYNVLKTQESTSAKGGPVDIGVYNLILSLEITVSGLKGTRFISRKSVCIFEEANRIINKRCKVKKIRIQ